MGDGHEERPGYDPAEAEAEALMEADQTPETQGIVARQDFRTRGDGLGYPGVRIPQPEEVLGKVCSTCHGLTWVLRGNPENDPVNVQMTACDDPNCPQLRQLGLREIAILSVPYNNFKIATKVGNSDKIASISIE